MTRPIAYLSALLFLSLHPPASCAPASEITPPRGDGEAIALGATVYRANCARCHGEQATGPSAEAPDLRRLDSFCNRLRAPALHDRCLQDVDAYFVKAVEGGKIRAGIVYMPPWKEALTRQEILAVRSYIDSLPPLVPRLKTSVDLAREGQKPR